MVTLQAEVARRVRIIVVRAVRHARTVKRSAVVYDIAVGSYRAGLHAYPAADEVSNRADRHASIIAVELVSSGTRQRTFWVCRVVFDQAVGSARTLGEALSCESSDIVVWTNGVAGIVDSVELVLAVCSVAVGYAEHASRVGVVGSAGDVGTILNA